MYADVRKADWRSSSLVRMDATRSKRVSRSNNTRQPATYVAALRTLAHILILRAVSRLEHRSGKARSPARIPFIPVLVALGIAVQIMSIGELRAQVPGAAGHEHLTEVACVDVRPGEKRPEFGCFNIGVVTGLHLSTASVYWHLRAFPSRSAAEAAKSATGIVVEEDGRAWLSEFGARNIPPRGGKAIAIVGPLQLTAAKSYAAVLSYAVMRPGDNSRVHTHPGPEAWYVLAGEQCLETPAGASRARAGGTMAVGPNIPMELNVTGTTLRRAFALVIHDSAQERGTPSDWKPSGACSR